MCGPSGAWRNRAGDSDAHLPKSIVDGTESQFRLVVRRIIVRRIIVRRIIVRRGWLSP